MDQERLLARAVGGLLLHDGVAVLQLAAPDQQRELGSSILDAASARTE